MKAVSLFGVLVIAHLIMLAGHSATWSVWTPFVYFWQDALVALLFSGIDYLLKRSRFSWVLYGVIVFYTAINVPIARILSSPLTWTMMRAARGPLRDSITYYLTPSNVGAIALVTCMGALIPLVLKKLSFKPRPWLALSALVWSFVGLMATGRIETSGFHRNAYGVLWPVGVSDEQSESATWRSSPFPSVAIEDHLRQFRGKAAGRNVVMIALESTAARYLKLYGAAQDPMPHLSELAANGIVFERAYSVYPESIKGLMSILCSRYPAFQTAAEAYAKVNCPALPKLLGDAGYRTALFHSGRFMYLGMESVIRDRGYQVLEDAGTIGGEVNSSFGVDEPAAVTRMLAWIDSSPKGQPFFLTYLPVAGHHPYATPAPGPFPTTGEFGNYLNALHHADESLGLLIKGLRDRGLEEQTLFVIFGDHGEAFRQHDGNSGHSMFLYDENVRVPYMIVMPGLLHGQTHAHATASLIDTAPTVLGLLGLPTPQGFQGTSVLESGNRMALFFTDYSLSLLGLYDACWKYIYEIDSARSRLFDVCRDQGEVIDRSKQEIQRTEKYRQHVRKWIASQKLPY
jgi:glucan phosphoethanolaminetransferase (alkaline phosphatase superfamily)